jgi:hypothetical protein
VYHRDGNRSPFRADRIVVKKKEIGHFKIKCRSGIRINRLKKSANTYTTGFIFGQTIKRKSTSCTATSLGY